ncbi:MAG: 50S ribosomal protein L18 [Candidatus Woykebacteria bacterium RBG_13_40_7b]|uniref:Large ribosomal subunit protein uL18 n=1 Tax=Candidatus Woykebacteria bacterium RBG_13_40_7b TaxID=1802594 RepID=A0A1G1W7W1_9BACT|nr:MAG: 50S ribosomal protein L18 [Candidatus Woykebacteria bacterium RBG_13_40_7b]
MKTRKTERKINKLSYKAKVLGSQGRPRLGVFRSNQHVYAFLVNDQEGKTLLSVNDLQLKNIQGTKTKVAFEVGKQLAKEAKEIRIKTVVFDRSGFLYHGRVKALAEGAREGGLEF